MARSAVAVSISALLLLLGASEVTVACDEARPRVELETFSILLPSGIEWRFHRGDGMFQAARSLDGSPLHTFILQAREYPPSDAPVGSVSAQELLAGVRAAAEMEARAPGRYELVSHEEAASSQAAMQCVEYRKRWNDRGGPKTQGKKLIMAAHGLVCVHPQVPARLIEVSYSHRSESSILPGEAELQGKLFLESLRPRAVGGAERSGD